MKKSCWFVFALLLCLMHSCTKPDPLGPDINFYVFSTISPDDSLITVSVSLIQYPENNTTKPPVILKIGGNAQVVISDKSRAYDLTYNEKTDQYGIDSTRLKIVTGATYKLSVTLPNGRTTTAETSIPAQNKTLTAKLDSISSHTYRLTAIWKDEDPATTIYAVNYNNLRYTTYDKINPNGILTSALPDLSFSSKPSFITLGLSIYAKEANTYIEPYLDSHRWPGSGNLTSGYGNFTGYNTYWIKVSL